MVEGESEQIHSRQGLGCLLVVLGGATLVSGAILMVGLAGMVLRLMGDDQRGATGHWFGVATMLFFFTPMVILFGRGAYLTFLRLRGRPTGGMVTGGIAMMIAVVYGLPGVAILIFLLVTDSDRVSVSHMLYGAFGSLLLLGSPFILKKMRTSAPGAATASDGDLRRQHRSSHRNIERS